MTEATLHKYAAGTRVFVPPTYDAVGGPGTIVGAITRYSHEREYGFEYPDAGPLYVVNVGDVFAPKHEYVFAESELVLGRPAPL